MQVGVVDAGLFSDVFTFNVEISQRLDSNLHTLCHSHTDQDGTLMELEQAQNVILSFFSIPQSRNKEEIIKDFYKFTLDEKGEKYKQEYFDIEESKQLLKREIEKTKSAISKEMKKFWNHIDTLILLSYKQMLYDVTGSNDIVNAFMKESRTVGIREALTAAKRSYDYKSISDMLNLLESGIEEFVYRIERIVTGAV